MLENKSGQKIPNVTFQTRQGHEWVDVQSREFFAGKTVALFSLPGAYTPTCSSSHVPRYNQLAGVLKENGVDEIVCMSVNDAFVMNSWKQDQDAENITFMPDGNGEFTEGMGMLVGKESLGFGKRSWRYSMLVKDGTIDAMFIEAEIEGDPFGVSDADTMLNHIAPNAKAPSDVVIFSRDGCAFCAKAKSLLTAKGMAYEEMVLNRDYTDHGLRAISGQTSYPQVFIDGKHIGGADAVADYLPAA